MENRRLRLMFGAFLGALVSGCASSPQLTLSSPASPAELRLADLARETANGNQNLHSLLIEYQGKAIVELYRKGWDSSLSGGGGIILARHHAYSVHSRIADFPEPAAKAPARAQEIDLGDLLGMTGGLSWKGDSVAYYLDRPLATKPGAEFNYSGGSIFAASRMIAPEWIQAVTAPRIGVNTDYFDLDAQGTRYGYGWWNGTVDWLGGRPAWFFTVGKGGKRSLSYRTCN